METHQTVDEYISNFSAQQQAVLQKIRATIRKVAPDATEKISYGIPTFTLKGPLIHFGGYEHHYAIYPGAAGVEAFKDKLNSYETSKGTIRFPADKPVPYDLIEEIASYLYAKKAL